MTRSNTIILLVAKLVVVGVLVVWLYTRIEADLKGAREEVAGAEATLVGGTPDGRDATVQLGQSQATQLYELARQSGWALSGGGPARAKFELRYTNGAVDQIDVLGNDKVAVNGMARTADPQMLQAVMLVARQNLLDAAETRPSTIPGDGG